MHIDVPFFHTQLTVEQQNYKLCLIISTCVICTVQALKRQLLVPLLLLSTPVCPEVQTHLTKVLNVSKCKVLCAPLTRFKNHMYILFHSQLIIYFFILFRLVRRGSHTWRSQRTGKILIIIFICILRNV